MKKLLRSIFLAIVLLLGGTAASMAQITIWQLGATHLSTSDCGTANVGRSVSVFGNDNTLNHYTTSWGEIGFIYYVQVDKGWENGSGTKGWSITVNTTSFQSLSVSFRPMSYKSSGADFGPRQFKMQYSLDNSSWTDVGAIYNALDSWASGEVTRTLPEACNNQPTVYIRWVMASNQATDGGIIRGTQTGPASAIARDPHWQA